MKSCILLLLFTILSSGLSFSQEEEEIGKVHPTHFRNEITINATFFIKEFLSFDSEIINPVSPFLITYKHIKNFNAFRFGIGWNIEKSSEEQAFGGGELEDKTNEVELRLGYERQVPLAKRWMVYLGLDGTYGKFKDVTTFDSGFDVVTTTTDQNSYGGGPVLGIQFFINKRMSLSTEGAMYYIYSNTEERITSQGFPDVNSTRKIENQQFTFNLPTSLFFGIWF